MKSLGAASAMYDAAGLIPDPGDDAAVQRVTAAAVAALGADRAESARRSGATMNGEKRKALARSITISASPASEKSVK